MSRNTDKGRESENAVAAFMADHGFPYAERRSKRGGHVDLDCACGDLTPPVSDCGRCGGRGYVTVCRDAGDLTGIPGVVVQVKWSPYESLAQMMRRTDEQRRVAMADVGLLVVKRRGVGLARAGEWDAYLPVWAVANLFRGHVPAPMTWDSSDPVRVSLDTACALLRSNYGAPLGVSV